MLLNINIFATEMVILSINRNKTSRLILDQAKLFLRDSFHIKKNNGPIPKTKE